MKTDCNLLLLSDRQSWYVDHFANDGISKQLRYLYDNSKPKKSVFSVHPYEDNAISNNN